MNTANVFVFRTLFNEINDTALQVWVPESDSQISINIQGPQPWSYPSEFEIEMLSGIHTLFFQVRK